MRPCDSIAALNKQIKKDKKRIREIEAAMVDGATADAAAGAVAAGALAEEMGKLRGDVEMHGAEVAKEEKERKFNADEMCYVATERSLARGALTSTAFSAQLESAP